FQGPSIRGELLLSALIAVVLLQRRLFFTVLPWGVLLSGAFCWYFFLQEAGAELLFSDDHSTFVYRLTILRDTFPYIPFYNPQWNAGLDARDSFATGVLNLFFLSMPW